MGLWNKPEVNLPSSSHHQSQYLLRSSTTQNNHREEESSDDVFHETLDLRTTTTDINSNEKQSLFNKRDPDALPWSLRAAPEEDTTNDEGEVFATTESIDETYQRIMAFQNITLPHECFVAVIDGSLFLGKLV